MNNNSINFANFVINNNDEEKGLSQEYILLGRALRGWRPDPRMSGRVYANFVSVTAGISRTEMAARRFEIAQEFIARYDLANEDEVSEFAATLLEQGVVRLGASY